MSRTPEHDERRIFDLYAAYMVTRVTELAVRLELFEACAQAIAIDQLAQRLRIGLRATGTMVTALAALGLLERPGGDVRVTPLAAEFLLKGSAFYKGTIFGLLSEEEFSMMRSWHLQDETPRPVNTRWLAGKVVDPDGQAAYMHGQTYAVACGFARHPFFSSGSARRLLDVAGGAGTVSIALAEANPALRCTVMDLRPLETAARALIKRHGVADRVEFVAGDMFKEVWPPGHDAILFSNIFHDWDEPRRGALARSTFAALPPGGHILVSEMLLDADRQGPLAAALYSMIMLFGQLGGQLTFADISVQLSQAGFVDVQVVTTSGYYTIVSARKP
jgi:acetylserotonin N-methyltransferase